MTKTPQQARASAPSNIALVKYWGKRDTQRNLPLTSSFSVSLSHMRSTATIQEAPGPQDLWHIHGNPNKAERVLQVAREATGDHRPLEITIENSFPSGAGLASSASSMAALALALNTMLAQDRLSTEEIATWARLGSGSSVRSLYPGYVLWDAGTQADGSDCIARTLYPAQHMPLALVVCVVDDQPKPIGSTAAMERCRETSPLYERFHTQNPADLKQATEAVKEQDFFALAEISEANCQAMHAIMHTAQPPINYFKPGTKAAIECVQKLRQNGTPCFFTIDAGPNVKVFCPPEHAQSVTEACEALPGVLYLLQDRVATSLHEDDAPQT